MNEAFLYHSRHWQTFELYLKEQAWRLSQPFVFYLHNLKLIVSRRIASSDSQSNPIPKNISKKVIYTTFLNWTKINWRRIHSLRCMLPVPRPPKQFPHIRVSLVLIISNPFSHTIAKAQTYATSSTNPDSNLQPRESSAQPRTCPKNKITSFLSPIQ